MFYLLCYEDFIDGTDAGNSDTLLFAQHSRPNENTGEEQMLPTCNEKRVKLQ